MSIILDALRKSESERLREAEAHRSELPRARGRTRMPWWVWAVALLLLANITLLLWLGPVLLLLMGSWALWRGLRVPQPATPEMSSDDARKAAELLGR
jgi:fatty acid desaturase